MEIQGRIIQVLPLASGVSRTGNNWKKQEYVLETKDQYPRKVLFHFFNNNVDQYPLQVGDDIILSFDIESRSFMGRDGVERWATDIRGYKAEKVTDQAQQPADFAPAAPQYQAPQPQYQQPQSAVPQYPAQDAGMPAGGDNTDDLPF